MSKQNQIRITLTDKEIELLDKYCESRGTKKATALKELAMRGLELQTTILVQVSPGKFVNSTEITLPHNALSLS